MAITQIKLLWITDASGHNTGGGGVFRHSMTLAIAFVV
jgi:hypothetical protein